MKTINILTTQFFPDNSSAADRINVLVDVLSMSEDYKINVIFLTEQGKDVDLKSLKKRFGDHTNIDFYPVKTRKYNTSRFLTRFMGEFFYSILLNKKNRRISADLSLVTVPFLMLLPVTAWYKLFTKRFFLLDVRDITWNSISDKKGNIFHFISWMFEKICLASAKKFDQIVTTTESQKLYFEYNHVKVPLKAIYNGVSNGRHNELTNLNLNKTRYKHKFVVSYLGRIGYPQNLSILVECADLLSDYNDIFFHIAGKGTDSKKIESLIAARKLENVEFLGELSWEGVKDLYAESDVLYAQIKDTPPLRQALPVKTLEYASTGLPVIFGGAGESARILKNFENCYLIEPDNPEILRDQLLALYNSDNKHISENDKNKIKTEFLREKILEQYIGLLDSILK
jgi:glycosyltransferase involved in cell wall biosynthesis